MQTLFFFLHLLKAFAQHCVLDTFPSVKILHRVSRWSLVCVMSFQFHQDSSTQPHIVRQHIYLFSAKFLYHHEGICYFLCILLYIYMFIYNIEIETESIHFCWTGLKNISKGQCKPWSIINRWKRPERAAFSTQPQLTDLHRQNGISP